MNSIFDMVKERASITEVVQHFGGVELRRGKCRCPFHEDKDPSFSVKESDNIWTCFAGCGSGDAIDFVAKIKGIDLKDACQILADFYGVSAPVSNGSKQRSTITLSATSGGVGAVSAPKAQDKYTKAQLEAFKERSKEYVKSAIARAGETDYFVTRGLTPETIKRFGLGYDSVKKCVVIPYSSCFSYHSTRSIEGRVFLKPNSDELGTEPIYNPKAMEQSGVVFVTEGQFCAMSIEQCGGRAISICGTNGWSKLLPAFKKKKPKSIFVLCLDNDEKGKEAQEKFARELEALDIKHIAYNVAGEKKDPNELLMTSPARLARKVATAIREAKAKYRTRKESICASELFAQEHKLPRTVVDSLIVEGITLLCAPQKLGKSWMVFDLCFNVAEGKDFWAYKTQKCDVLYYCLEDPEWRIVDRMKKLFGGNPPPKGVRIVTESDKLGDGLLEQIQKELAEHPNTGLIVIDTLKMIRKVNSKSNDIYGHDYEEIGQIKKFAERNKIAIVIVHHTRKSKDDSDPFSNILGTGGLTGAVDSMIVVMKKKRADKEAVFSVTGRDVEERELIVEWNRDTWRWIMAGDAEDLAEQRQRLEYENDPLVITVKALMEASPYGWTGTPTELLMAIYDTTGNTAQSPTTVGAKVQRWKNQLYYDGICHEEKKVRGQKKHCYYKKTHRPMHFAFMKNDNEEDSD